MTDVKNPIKELRTKLKMSQRDFSRLIGKSQAFASDLEFGAVDLPNDALENLRDLGLTDEQIEELTEDHEKYMNAKLSEIKRIAAERLK